MKDQQSATASSEHSVWIWIILAALLALSVLISVGALALVNANQQVEVPTGSQAVPTSR